MPLAFRSWFFYSHFMQRCWNISLSPWSSENVICCSGPWFVLHYITSVGCISVLSLVEVMLTCLKRLENSRIIIHQDCLMQRQHLWLRKFTNRECTDALRVFWINSTAYVPWLFYCSLGTCCSNLWLETESGVRRTFAETCKTVLILKSASTSTLTLNGHSCYSVFP